MEKLLFWLLKCVMWDETLVLFLSKIPLCRKLSIRQKNKKMFYHVRTKNVYVYAWVYKMYPQTKQKSRFVFGNISECIFCSHQIFLCGGSRIERCLKCSFDEKWNFSGCVVNFAHSCLMSFYCILSTPFNLPTQCLKTSCHVDCYLLCSCCNNDADS